MIDSTQILNWDDVDSSEINSFVENHNEGLFYYKPRFIKFLEKILSANSISILLKRNGLIEAIFPLIIKKGVYGNVINSLPFFGSNGGILSSNEEAGITLFKYFIKYIRKFSPLSSTIISNPFENKISFRGPLHDFRIAQWTDLTKLNSYGLPENSDSSVKRNLKKALSNNIKITQDQNSLFFLKEIHLQNMNAIGGKIKPDNFFEYIPKFFDYGKEWNLFLAKIDNNPIAALLTFQCSKTVEYFMPVTKVEFRNIQPSSLLLHHAMNDAKNKGFFRWNWGGTWLGQEGVYKFKKKWGAKECKYKYHVDIDEKKFNNLPLNKIIDEYPFFYLKPFKNNLLNNEK